MEAPNSSKFGAAAPARKVEPVLTAAEFPLFLPCPPGYTPATQAKPYDVLIVIKHTLIPSDSGS
jgi:hypothetical protein